MDNQQKIMVRQDFDVIVARSRVRDLARRMGMSTTDQARISLATSSAARAMGLGGSHQGEIVLGYLDGEGHSGVRVICRSQGKDMISASKLSDARFMTDELTCEQAPSGDLVVTLIKWTK